VKNRLSPASTVRNGRILATQGNWRPNLRDEVDNFIYEIAVAAAPCTIVTHNVRDFRGGEIQFLDVQIRTPAEVLNQLKQ